MTQVTWELEPLNEPVLDDDYPMYGGYMYVVDGKLYRCEDFNGEENKGISVGLMKRRYGMTEVRRCDIQGRIDRLPPQPERSDYDRRFNTQMGDDPNLRPHRWRADGRTINQAKRRPRSSNKIKKVK